MADTFASFPVNRRIPEIDYLRGFAMLCIVLGHAVMLLPRAFDYHAYTLSHLLVVSVYSFHLEILFFVAGFCYTCSDYKSFIAKKCRHILLPYIFFGTAQVLVNAAKIYWTNGSVDIGMDMYDTFLYGKRYWFLGNIFLMFLLYPWLEKLCSRKILLVMGLVLLNIFFTFPKVLTLFKLMYYFIYFVIGDILANPAYKERIFSATVKQKKIGFLSSLGLFIVSFLAMKILGIHILFRIGMGLSLVAGISVLILWFPFYKMNNYLGKLSGKLLTWCSIFSLQIYLFDDWWQWLFCLVLPIKQPYLLSPLLFVLDVGLSLAICKYILPKSAFLRYVCGVLPTRAKPLTDCQYKINKFDKLSKL